MWMKQFQKLIRHFQIYREYEQSIQTFLNLDEISKNDINLILSESHKIKKKSSDHTFKKKKF